MATVQSFKFVNKTKLWRLKSENLPSSAGERGRVLIVRLLHVFLIYKHKKYLRDASFGAKSTNDAQTTHDTNVSFLCRLGDESNVYEQERRKKKKKRLLSHGRPELVKRTALKLKKSVNHQRNSLRPVPFLTFMRFLTSLNKNSVHLQKTNQEFLALC